VEVKLENQKATLLPSTHHLKGKLYVKDDMIALHDLTTIFRTLNNISISVKNGMYLWYYIDTLPPSIEHNYKSTAIYTKLSDHMRHLFHNTHIENIAYSNNVNILTFDEIPKIPDNIPYDYIIAFALDHLVSKHTNKTLFSKIEINNNDDIIKIKQPIVDINDLKKYDDIRPISDVSLYIDITGMNSIINDYHKFQKELNKLKMGEMKEIEDEINMLRNMIINAYTKNVEVIDLYDILKYRIKLKKLNKRLTSYAWK
jgi:hypothetical protein